MPHWIFDAVSSQPTESWPTVLIRDGSKAATGAKRKLQVSFSVSVPFDGDRIIKAESESGELLIGEQSVTFKKGTVVKAPFTFTRVPSTVDKLSGVKLKWFVKKGTSGSFTETCQTQHTFFIIDKKPQMANLVINWSHLDIYLFELFDWSCSWAKGKTGTKDILAGIWSQFYPARQVHATNLVYWKIRNARLLPQSIIDAILSQDDPNPNRQNGASCIVFDRILINCLGIQGIKAAEIMIHVSADSSNGFPYAGSTYSCKSFNASTVKAQGNFNAPSTWLSHWIADVYDDSSNNSSSYTIKSGDTLSKIAKQAGITDWRTIYNDPQNADFRKKRPDPDKIYPGDTIWIPDPSNAKTSAKWKIYDASYGVAAYDSNDPNVNDPVDVFSYEKVAVKDFSCTEKTTLNPLDIPPGATPTEPPHLTGDVLWTP
jgi:hypothetical protein